MTSSASDPRPTEPALPVIVGYTLSTMLGEGGFGRVFEATETGPAQVKRAIKLVQPSAFNPSAVIDERFRREASALAKLKHDHVVTYVTADYAADRTPYLVMEFVEGRSLNEADFDDPINALRAMIKPIKMPIPSLVTLKTRGLRSGQSAVVTGQTPESAIKLLQGQLVAHRYPVVVTILAEWISIHGGGGTRFEVPPAPTFARHTPSPPVAPATASRFDTERILSLVVEVGMVGSLKEGATLPPSEVSFLPASEGANGALTGAKRSGRLKFDSPVRFLPAGRDLTVRNRFVLDAGSDLIGQPISALRKLDVLEVPIITIAFGKVFDRMKGVDVNLKVNGQDLWQTHVSYDVPFQQGPRVKLPLRELHDVLDGVEP